MQTNLISIAVMTLAGGLAASFAATEPSPISTPEAIVSAFHCQVPCGIYGDKMRIDMLLEDSATIEKAMAQLSLADGPAPNQMVRWIMTKEEHAAKIQETVASYWLAQRIKAPKDRSDTAAMDTYHLQLELLHGITVAAMKCKQTTDSANVDRMRSLAKELSATYFSKEDQKHLNEHSFER